MPTNEQIRNAAEKCKQKYEERCRNIKVDVNGDLYFPNQLDLTAHNCDLCNLFNFLNVGKRACIKCPLQPTCGHRGSPYDEVCNAMSYGDPKELILTIKNVMIPALEKVIKDHSVKRKYPYFGRSTRTGAVVYFTEPNKGTQIMPDSDFCWKPLTKRASLYESNFEVLKPGDAIIVR